MRYSYLFICVLIILISGGFYLYNANLIQEKEFKKKLKQIEQERLLEDRIFAEDFKVENLERFVKNQGVTGDTKKIVIYSNLTGCGKCIEHHLHLASKLNDPKNIVFIFYAFNKSQIKRMIKHYHIKSNVYFDKYDQVSKLFGVDTRKLNPFAFFVYDEKIFKIKFSYENDDIYLSDLLKYLR